MIVKDNLKEEKETERLTRDQEEATIITLEIATRIITIMVFILMNALIVTDFGAELVELPFLLNTDHSGMKMRALRWLNFTRRELEPNGQDNAEWEDSARIVTTQLQEITPSTDRLSNHDYYYKITFKWLRAYVELSLAS